MSARKGRGWPYVGVVVSLGTSLAGNVAHMLSQPGRTGWGVLVAAGVFAPIATWIAVEVALRANWRPTFRHRITRLLGVLPVAGVTAWVSWRHLSSLLVLSGEDIWTARIYAASVDTLGVMSAVALVVTAAVVQDSDRPSLAERVRAARQSVQDIKGAALGRVPDGQPSLVVDIPALPPLDMPHVGRITPDYLSAVDTQELPAQPRKRRVSTVMTPEHTERATRLIKDTLDPDRMIAIKVWGPTDDAKLLESRRKMVQRLRGKLREAEPVDLPGQE